MIRFAFILAILVALLLAPASAAPAPATLEIRAYADVRGLSVYWQAQPEQVWACAQRRGAWPPLADTLVGCVETRGGVMHVPIRDLNLRMDQGGETLLTLHGKDMQVIGWGREPTRVKYQTWLGVWGG